eukprot:Phypoly_transcript_24975.p1 GENE.Phypoly_transcript_24975~~Phypoly_transcript_24975.p1  ORF type:complete len:149 (+),score=17.90 Phypoly_transcript_24975:48-494(+)
MFLVMAAPLPILPVGCPAGCIASSGTLVTNQELSSIAAGAGAPAWFAAANAATMAQLMQLNINLANVNAKLVNAQATRAADPLAPLQNAAGVAHVDFPATRGAMAALTTATCNALLAHYGLPVPVAVVHVGPRRELLRSYFGVPLPEF